MIDRFYELERAKEDLTTRLANALGRIAALEQASARQWNAGNGGGLGSSGQIGLVLIATPARGGTVPASNVEIYNWSSGSPVDTGIAVTAACATSRTTAAGNGLDVGNVVWVQTDSTGTTWASPLDCT